MATSVYSVQNSSDEVKDYVCGACESKNIGTSADYFCGTCMKFFCEKCIYHHDQIYQNHSKYGRGETNKWPLTKKAEDLLLKCDVHNDKKLNMFCQDHSQLCCSDCILLNHRQCSNVAFISESVKKLSVDMQQLSNNLQTILYDLNKFMSTQKASRQTMERSYSERLQEIRNKRQELNAALDKLENTTLKHLDEIKAAMQTSIKEDIGNCNRLKDELQQLSDAVEDLGDKSKKEIEFIASRKCLNKIQESETYLRKNSVKAQRTIIFQADIDIEQYLSKQSSLGRIVESTQSLTLKMNPEQIMTVKRKSEYEVEISSDKSQTCCIADICSLPNGQVIVAEFNYSRVILLDQQYNVASHCDFSDSLFVICQVTSSEVALVVGSVVQFISVINGQLVKRRKFQLNHDAAGIVHHQESLYVTSGTALYHYNMTGTLVKKIYEDIGVLKVFRCAVSPDGDRIYVINYTHHKLITLATDGTLISTFTDPNLQHPWDVHVTPSGQVLVCSKTIIQVDREGKKNLATLASKKDGLLAPLAVCFNSNTNSIIVGFKNSNKFIVLEMQTVDFTPEFANQPVATAVNAAGQALITAKAVFKTWQDKQEANKHEMAKKSDESSKTHIKGWKPAGTRYTAQDESGYVPKKSDLIPPKQDFKPPKSDWKPTKPDYKPPKPPKEKQYAAPQMQSTPPVADGPMSNLMEMGFFDIALNQRLLEKFDNNIQKVVQELLSMKNKYLSK